MTLKVLKQIDFSVLERSGEAFPAEGIQRNTSFALCLFLGLYLLMAVTIGKAVKAYAHCSWLFHGFAPVT